MKDKKAKPKPKTPKSPQNRKMKISKTEVNERMVWFLFQKLFPFVWNQCYISHFSGQKEDLEPIAFTVIFFAGVCILKRVMKKELDYELLWTPIHPNTGRCSEKIVSWSSEESTGSNHSCWKENSTQRGSVLARAVWGKCWCGWVQHREQKQSNKQNELWREQESWIPTYSFPLTVDAQHHDSWHIETCNSTRLCVLIQLCIAIAV